MDHQDFKALKAAAREEELEALRDGRKNRSASFTQRKAQADKNACRDYRYSND